MLMLKRWCRSKKYLTVTTVALCLAFAIYNLLKQYQASNTNLELTRRYIEQSIEKALLEDKGTGCEMPKLDPFAKEVIQLEKKLIPRLQCLGTDWVKCNLSKCRVVKQILDTTDNIECTYEDILYESDAHYRIGAPTVVTGDNVYTLDASDHVKIYCTGRHTVSSKSSKWKGYAAGFRKSVRPKRPPKGREKSFNVLILGFDSTARNGFIRRMPRSYSVLKNELGATVLESYNVLGDGTPASLFPILTGRTELELPECRRSIPGSGHIDSMPFIFYKLKDDGYRTAYFEDSPWIGTFQYRFNGFLKQPADHYLRAFYLEESKSKRDWSTILGYCLGDTPQYKIMLNLTNQFFKLDGKRFAFTFIADITHDDFNMISMADDDVVEFLRDFKRQGHLKDTMLMVMGDHGPRYSANRNLMQGRFEERLPLMAVVLPDDLKVDRPDAQTNLDSNVHVLTTPHDVHATLLDVIDMRDQWNPYTVRGADLTRGLTLLQSISRNRSCSEAGIEPHWCACTQWTPLPSHHPMHLRTANALLDYINQLTHFVRSECVPRMLRSIEWVTRQQVRSGLLQFSGAKDGDGYFGKFDPNAQRDTDMYQIQIVVGPGSGRYEAVLTHYRNNDTLSVNLRQISRISAYNTEPACISDTYPHLNKYCYCRNQSSKGHT